MLLTLSTIVESLANSSGFPPEPSPWLTPLMTFLGIILGGGGVATIIKVRADRKLGIEQQEVNEDDAIAGRWQKIIETQTQALVDPLTKRLGEVEANVKVLELEVKAIRSKYWKAIAHIRSLVTWIRRHYIGEDIPPLPEPPVEIAEDI